MPVAADGGTTIDPTSLVGSFGYAAIFLLSVAQSCCVPTSSELTLGFAGALAATGHLALPSVILVGAAGEVVGAYLAWAIGRTAGRAIIDRFGKYVLVTHHDLDRAEAWYGRHPRSGVFGGRLLPVVRNFVALPAGVAEVPALRFGLLTAAGSLIWDGAMAGIGYGVGSRWRSIVHAFSDAGYVLAALVVVAAVALVAHRWRSYGAQMRVATAAPAGAPGGEALEASALGPAAPSGAAPGGLVNPREELVALVRRRVALGSGTGEPTGVGANERLTAAAAGALFVLLFVEGLTLVRIGSMMAMHTIVGLILVPPVLIKLASTSWRFVRYYTGHPQYVRKGPPQVFLRVIAPFLVATTVVLFASGIALVVVHDPYGWLAVVHRYVFVAWFFILSAHVLAYMWQVPGTIRRDVSRKRVYRATSPRGRLLRVWLVVGSIAAGAALAAIVWPSVSSQVHTFFRPAVTSPHASATLGR